MKLLEKSEKIPRSRPALPLLPNPAFRTCKTSRYANPIRLDLPPPRFKLASNSKPWHKKLPRLDQKNPKASPLTQTNCTLQQQQPQNEVPRSRLPLRAQARPQTQGSRRGESRHAQGNQEEQVPQRPPQSGAQDGRAAEGWGRGA